MLSAGSAILRIGASCFFLELSLYCDLLVSMKMSNSPACFSECLYVYGHQERFSCTFPLFRRPKSNTLHGMGIFNHNYEIQMAFYFCHFFSVVSPRFLLVFSVCLHTSLTRWSHVPRGLQHERSGDLQTFQDVSKP